MTQQRQHTHLSSDPIRSRRIFLAQAAGAGVGLAASSMMAPAVHAAGDDTLKIALVGCGGRGTGAIVQALNTKGPVVLWAMADIFQERIDSCLTSLGNAYEGRYDQEKRDGLGRRVQVAKARQFVGFDAYRQAIDCGVDVVLLTTFPHFRPPQFEYAVKQGKHVFMEKPVAVDAPGIRRILAANEVAKKKNLKVAVGLQRHHNEIYQETVQRIHDGAVGKLMSLRCYWNGGGGGSLRPHPAEMGEMEYQCRNRYVFTWLCGDHNVEQHVHNIDVCNWIMNDHPVTANGMGGRAVRNGKENGEIFDHHAVEYTYADGTIMHSQCRQIAGCWSQIAESVSGMKGSADLTQRECRITAGERQWNVPRVKANPYQVEHDVLFNCIRNDIAHNEGDYGAHSTMTAIMGRMATYSGKMIEWDPAINSELALVPSEYSWDGIPPVVPDENGVYPCAIPGVTKVL